MLKRSVILTFTIILTVNLVDSLRNSMRTVKVCTPASENTPHLFTESKPCEEYCSRNFIHVNHNLRFANKGLARASVGTNEAGIPQCCCEFNTFWPDFVHPSAAGVKLHNLRRIGATSCLPLVVTLKVCKRSVQSYETICKYLAKKEPLTMLELIDFLAAATYLRTVRPRHPSIHKTINLKEVKTIDKNVFKNVQEAINKYFLTSYKPLEQYEGARLETSFLREMTTNLMSFFMETQRSRVVAEAIDEYMTSYVMVDIHAAFITILDINRNQLLVPENLLVGDYDKYNKNNKAGFFLQNCNCSLLRKVKADLTRYLRTISQVLASLSEKLIYEHLAIDFKDLTYLVHSEKIYNNLFEVNCQRRQ